MREFTFDVTLCATIRVMAATEKDARALLARTVDGTEANLGAWPDGNPVLCGVSLEGEVDLVEIDGEATP